MFFLISINLSPLSAQWSNDPTQNTIVQFWGLFEGAVTDGEGGIIMHARSSNGYNEFIYVQRVDRMGYSRWLPNGIQITGERELQIEPLMVSDSEGGALIGYQDADYTMYPVLWESRVCVQRIDHEGNLLWDPAGIRLSLSEDDQRIGDIISDNAGGVVAAWRNTVTDDLYLQRIDSTGQRLWGDEGMQIGEIESGAAVLVNTSDGNFIAFWPEQWGPQQWGIFQKFNLDGVPNWMSPGINLYLGGCIYMCPDENNAIIVSGNYWLGPYRRIIAQRIDYSGELLWGDEGITICDSVNATTFYTPISEFSDGSFVFSWYNEFAGLEGTVFAQRVSPDGETLWEENGVLISADPYEKRYLNMVKSNDDTFIFVFQDSRHTDPSIYAQKLDIDGNRQWDNDVLVHIATPMPYSLDADTDGAGGAIATWYSTGGLIIGAQQISGAGNLAEVNYVPAITDLTISVADDIVHLDWQDIEYASGYKVFSSSEYPVESIPENLLEEVTNSEYSGTMASWGNSQFYMVVAED